VSPTECARLILTATRNHFPTKTSGPEDLATPAHWRTRRYAQAAVWLAGSGRLRDKTHPLVDGHMTLYPVRDGRLMEPTRSARSGAAGWL
jgi:hypothetical protein